MDKQSKDPSVSVHFDYAWVIPPSLFDDSDMDPQVGRPPGRQVFM